MEADQEMWTTIFEMVNEKDWSLNDAIYQMTESDRM